MQLQCGPVRSSSLQFAGIHYCTPPFGREASERERTQVNGGELARKKAR